MLIKRIITASILAAMVVLAVFQLPVIYFSLFIAIITFMGAWEWLTLINVTSVKRRLLFLLLLILPMLGVTYWTVFLEILSDALEWPEIKDYSDALEWLCI